jgi:SNF family Na+-dependent transporter
MYVMNDSKVKAAMASFGCGGCLVVILVVLLIHYFVGGWLVQYSVQEWKSKWEGHRVEVEFWKCGLAAIPLAEVAVPAAVITWLVDPAKDIGKQPVKNTGD